MFPRKPVPVEVRRGPVSRAEALNAGVSLGQLRGPSWKRVGRGLYLWTGQSEGPWTTLAGLAQRLPSGCAFSGLTAASVHGLDLGIEAPIEVSVPPDVALRDSADWKVRHACLHQGDLVRRRGLPVTSLMRTLFDLARRLSLADAVAALDWSLHQRRVSLAMVCGYFEERGRWPGGRRAARALELADPRAESPMESRLRVLLVEGGLPRPDVQLWVGDRRLDLAYRQARLGIEYDGDGHRERLADDNRRQNWLLAQGYVLLRFTAADVYQRPAAVVAQVAQQLAARHQ